MNEPEFCCQAAEKMYHLTDPNAPLSMVGFGGRCIICGDSEPYTYHVPENLWRVIIPEQYWHSIVCAKCFHNLAVNKQAGFVVKA